MAAPVLRPTTQLASSRAASGSACVWKHGWKSVSKIFVDRRAPSQGSHRAGAGFSSSLLGLEARKNALSVFAIHRAFKSRGEIQRRYLRDRGNDRLHREVAAEQPLGGGHFQIVQRAKR